MLKFTDKNFNEAHGEANGEGVEYIKSLALALAGSLTKAGVKINGQRLIEKLNSIADNEGMGTVRDANLLQTRLELNEIIEPSKESNNEIINPENLYGDVLADAYSTAVGRSIGKNLGFCIDNIAHELSIAFKKEGKSINKEQIMSQINIIFEHQKRMDSINNGFFDPQESAMRMFVGSNRFIENLCMRLQLAGLLE